MEQPTPDRLVSDFSLSLLASDGGEEVKVVSDNIQRLVVIDVAPTLVTDIRITILKTYGCSDAVISEIRVY